MDNELFVKGWRVGVQGWVWGGDGGGGWAHRKRGLTHAVRRSSGAV